MPITRAADLNLAKATLAESFRVLRAQVGSDFIFPGCQFSERCYNNIFKCGKENLQKHHFEGLQVVVAPILV